MAGLNNSDEPQFDRWYNLTLGSSFKDDHPSKFCTLRYEFKPASIDKDQRGSLLKRKDNKVTVEFPHNQPGKSKVIFEGSTEDYKENDAVLFFDGESLRLERLHRAVKRLRYNRQGESNATVPGVAEANSPPLGKGNKPQPSNKDPIHALPVEVERIEVGEFKASDTQPRHERSVGYPAPQVYSSNPSPELDIVNTDDDAIAAPVEVREYDSGNVEVREYDSGNVEVREYDSGNVEVTEYETGNVEVKEYDTGIDINKPQVDVDDEIDFSDDGENKGPNAAEALKAQLHSGSVERNDRTSSSSDDSSGTSSSSESSSDGESSDADTVDSI